MRGFSDLLKGRPMNPVDDCLARLRSHSSQLLFPVPTDLLTGDADSITHRGSRVLAAFVRNTPDLRQRNLVSLDEESRAIESLLWELKRADELSTNLGREAGMQGLAP